MSLSPTAGDLVSVNAVFTNVASATAINVLHYRIGSLSGTVPNQTTFLGKLALDVLNGFITHWAPCASDQVKLVNTRATSLFPLPRSVGVNAVATPAHPGDVIDQALPLQDAVTILKRTAVGARWGLGRVFITGIAEADQANGIITNDLRTRLDTLATWLGGALTLTGSGWTAVMNPVLVRGPDDNPVSITNILNCEVSDNVLKTQRRRRPGKGI